MSGLCTLAWDLPARATPAWMSRHAPQHVAPRAPDGIRTRRAPAWKAGGQPVAQPMHQAGQSNSPAFTPATNTVHSSRVKVATWSGAVELRIATVSHEQATCTQPFDSHWLQLRHATSAQLVSLQKLDLLHATSTQAEDSHRLDFFH